MVAATTQTPLEVTREQDQRVILHDVSWSQYETILAIRGDNAGVRLTYVNGELELMSFSLDHERRRWPAFSKRMRRSAGWP